MYPMYVVELFDNTWVKLAVNFTGLLSTILATIQLGYRVNPTLVLLFKPIVTNISNNKLHAIFLVIIRLIFISEYMHTTA